MKTHASIKTAAPPGRDASVARHAPQRQPVPGLAAAGAGSAAMTLQRHREMANQSSHALQLRQQAKLLAQRMEKPNHTGLPDRLKSGVESLSGMSMDHVRVHYNSDKPAQLQAHAYAQGRDIHLAPGQERHLPHEAWHIVQQAQGRVRPTLQMKGGIAVNDDAGLEREADLMGAQADGLGGTPLQAMHAGYPAAPVAAPVMQRVVLSKLELDKIEADEPDQFFVRDVIIAGRTPSPFTGTMGAHSTAWIAHIDQVRRTMVNSPLNESATNMLSLVHSELAEATDEKVPTSLYHLKDRLSERHQALLTAARLQLQTNVATLEQLLLLAPSGITDEAIAIAVQAELQKLINSYLTFINYLPGSTIQGGDPNGHGEGSARSDISGTEYLLTHLERHREIDKLDENKFTPEEKAQLKNNLLGQQIKTLSDNDLNVMIKDGELAKAEVGDALIDLLIGRLWTLFAAETPAIFAANHHVDELLTWRLMLKKFLATIRTAYPYTFDLTRMQEAAQQRKGLQMGCELARVSLSETLIKELFEDPNTAALSDYAEVRDIYQYPEVTLSDLNTSAAGFQATILMSEAKDPEGSPVIGAVETVGRTTSPFSGTMGAHSTAWAVHVDALQRMLQQKTLANAIRALHKRASQALDDESLALANVLSEKHQVCLIGAFNVLRNSLELDSTGMMIPARTRYLENLIASYLSYINFLPMSTVEIGAVPGGRSEGRHRTFLNNYEEHGINAIPESERSNWLTILRQHLTGMYDGKAAGNFPPMLGKRENTDFAALLEDPFDDKHPLFGKIHSKAKPNDKNAIARRRFLHTMLEAYPRASMDGNLTQLPAWNDNALNGPKQHEQRVQENEHQQLKELVNMNNCLINAINLAAGGPGVTFAQMLAIRLRIGEFGTMLLATPGTVNIILQQLGINRGVVVMYPGLPSEDFGDTTHHPLIIEHVNGNHFVPYVHPAERTDTLMRDVSASDDINENQAKRPGRDLEEEEQAVIKKVKREKN